MEQHSTTKNDHEVIGSASQPHPGLAHQDKKTRGHVSQPTPNGNDDVVGSASQPRPGHFTSQHDDLVGSASQPLTQPIDRSRVRFVEPDTHLPTDWLAGLIFDAYSSRYHASVKIIIPLSPQESTKTLSQRTWTLRELEHGKVGDLEVVVTTKERYSFFLEGGVPVDSSDERVAALFTADGLTPNFNQIEEEHGLKVLAWAVHGPRRSHFRDRAGIPLPVWCFAGGPHRN